jgi:hypothetical protein
MNIFGIIWYFGLCPVMAFCSIHYALPYVVNWLFQLSVSFPLWVEILYMFPVGYFVAYISDYRNTCPYHISGVVKSSGWDGEIR